MSLRMDMKLLGAKDIENLLSKLPDKIGEKVLKQSMSAATKPMVRLAKSLVPVKSGNLRKNIVVKPSRKKIKGNHAVLFGATKKAPYAHLVELGTQSHVIKPKKAKFLKIFGSYVKEVRHGGSRARPFIRPAFDRERGNWFKYLGKEIGKRVDKEAKKLRKL
jgi:HK97 gp10 family phage protein